MKHQIQIYNIADNSKRHVVAETAEVATQDQINTWYQNQMQGVELKEGQQVAVIPENHGWFLTSTPKTPTEGPNEVSALTRTSRPVIGDQASFDSVASLEKQKAKERQFADAKRQAALAEHMAAFKG